MITKLSEYDSVKDIDGQSPYQDGVVGIEDWKAFVINIHSSVC